MTTLRQLLIGSGAALALGGCRGSTPGGRADVALFGVDISACPCCGQALS